ncbi:hypothetical protein BY458DRAFT_507164 [Sporodiniella umbellata]|nr:hypothetical protein BY458DRAFT_507164 [Sporodiniella umbellata]
MTEIAVDHPMVIQLVEEATRCECQDFVLGHCIHCKAMVSTAFQPTQTQLSLLQSQHANVLTEKEDLEEKIAALEEVVQDREKAALKTTADIGSLQHDLRVLQEKWDEEAAQVKAIQTSKEIGRRELEELTQKLFEEAESMVHIEKAEQALLDKENQRLTSHLHQVRGELETASGELNLLKRQMTQENEQPAYLDAYLRAQLDILTACSSPLEAQVEAVEDDSALMGFSDFMQTAGQTPLRKLHSLKYMKYAVREDVEPCLRFGPQPRIAAKKIVDAILVKTCFVEECPEGFVDEQYLRQKQEVATASLWERFTQSSIFSGCQACGRNVTKDERESVLKYRFRISYFDEWACVDRYCRDRLVAVIEFYSFIRHMRAGLYKHRSLHELYQQMSLLRLQMFLARMGALPYLLSSSHLSPQRVTTAFHGEEIVLSHFLDTTSERLSSSTDSTLTSISTLESIRTLSSH